MAHIFLHTLIHSIEIIMIVFVLMVLVELVELKYSRSLRRWLTDRKSSQRTITGLLGLAPGCGGTFLADSLYMSGVIGFGGIVTTMLVTFGDEAFIIIAAAVDPNHPVTIRQVALLAALLFVLGLFGGWLADLLHMKTGISFRKSCEIEHHEDYIGGAFSFSHFLKEHVYGHIVKQHIWKIFLWLFGTLLAIEIMESAFDVQSLLTDNQWILLGSAVVIGILPLSGPNLIFFTLFAEGHIGFSILLANSLVQDGHGLLPLLGFSVEDAVKIKIFNAVFGLAVGALILAFGY